MSKAAKKNSPSYTVLFFVISADSEHGALELELRDIGIKDVFDKMQAKKTTSVSFSDFSEDQEEEEEAEGWEVDLVSTVEVDSLKTAKKVVGIVDCIADAGGYGDYDSLKQKRYGYLVLNSKGKEVKL